MNLISYKPSFIHFDAPRISMCLSKKKKKKNLNSMVSMHICGNVYVCVLNQASHLPQYNYSIL